MRKFRFLALQIVMLVLASSVHGQATRTWVSGVGDDVNPCSRTAPCKTWAGAISKTAAGGEINALDPGGFGTLTITKSITVDGGGFHASSLNSGGINGFVINDSATATPNTIKVVLRNVAVNGAGTTKGLNGVRFISGRELTLENVFIHNQSNRGIDIQRASGAPLALVNILNTTITMCGSAAIGVNATSTNGAVRIAIAGSRLTNSASGLFAGQAVEGTISNSLIANNTFVGVDAGSTSVINVDDSMIMNNSMGVQTSGSSILRLSRTAVVQNASRGFSVAGGQIQSYGDNYLSGNGPNSGSLTNIASSKQ